MRLWIAGALISVLSLGCNGGAGGTTNPDPGGGSGTAVGTMSARIDGTLWTATSVIATRTPASTGVPIGTLAVSGTGTLLNQSITLTFAVPPAVGIYTLGPGAGTPGATQNASLTNSATGARWIATSLTGSGTISVNTASITGATGSFAFNLAPDTATSATATRIVTEGAFGVTF